MVLGSINLTLELARTTLADTTRWRSIVNANNQAEALDHIYIGGLPSPAADEYELGELKDLRPSAMVILPDSGGLRKSFQSVGQSGNEYLTAGSVVIEIHRDVSPEYECKITESVNAFNEDVGVILDELGGLAGQAGYLNASTIEIIDGPYRIEEDAVDGYGDLNWVRIGMSFEGSP